MNITLILEIVVFSFIPFLMMNIGGLSGVFLNINSYVRSLTLHLAAGVIFAVVAVEILPEILKKHSIVPIIIGFSAGVATMLLIRRLSRKSEDVHKQKITHGTLPETVAKELPLGMLVGIGVDIVLDGFLLGIGFAAGQKEGVLLCIALSIELLALGLVVTAELKSEKFSNKFSLKAVLILSASIIVGTFIGALFLHSISGEVLTGLLSFGLAALMYLITEELMVEAHKEKDSTIGTTVFFLGFLIFLVIGVIE